MHEINMNLIFTLWVGLDHGEEVGWSKNLGNGIVGLATKWVIVGWGLHCGQDFFSGELQTWIKYDMAVNMTTFFAKGILGWSSFLGNSNP